MLRSPSRTIGFTCGHCGHAHEVAAALAGRKGRCAGCKRTVRVPDGSGSGSQAELEVSPPAKAVRASAEPTPRKFLHTRKVGERWSACLVVIDRRSLRALEWEELSASCSADELLSQVEAAKQDQRVPLDRIREVAANFHGGLDLIWRGKGGDERLHLALGEAAAQEAMDHLRSLAGFRASERQVPLGQAVGVPAVLGGFTLVLAAIAYPTASALREQHLRFRGVAGLVAGIIELLGPTGVLALTGAILAAVALTVASRVNTPPRVAVLTPA